MKPTARILRLVAGCVGMLCAAAIRAPVPTVWTVAASPAVATAPMAIVVNRSNPVDGLSSAELRSIFLGSRTYWPSGKRITILMREPGDPERRFVLREVCGMSEWQFKTHFLHGLYTGEILVSPKILETPSGVKKFIFNVPGAIGYLPVEELDDSVKVLRIDEKLPADKGYPLRFETEAEN